MAAGLELRAQLSMGRHPLDPARVCEVAEWISTRPRRIPSLLELLWDDDPGVANRAADVLERITVEASPALLRAVSEYKDALLGLISEARFIKLRWNLALTLPRLKLTVPECRRIAAVLESWLEDRSSIVKTAALHGLAQLTRQDPASREAVMDILRTAGRSGTPAMRARSRILLKQMQSPRPKVRSQGSPHMYD